MAFCLYFFKINEQRDLNDTPFIKKGKQNVKTIIKYL